jgi:uncharacterized membrane protein YhaH (DUF805 family)
VDRYAGLGLVMQAMYEAIWFLEKNDKRYSYEYLYPTGKVSRTVIFIVIIIIIIIIVIIIIIIVIVVIRPATVSASTAMYEAIWFLEKNNKRYSYEYLYPTGKISRTIIFIVIITIITIIIIIILITPVTQVTDRPAGWHPGPHGHRLRGEILAYHYLAVLRRAIAESLSLLEAGPRAVTDFIAETARPLPIPGE